MGLNRFYTYNGQILKTADGNPIGYEYIPYPTDGLFARWTWDSSTTDVYGGLAMTQTGTITYEDGPNGSTAASFANNAYLLTNSWPAYQGDLSFFTWLKTTVTSIAGIFMVGANNTTTTADIGIKFLYRSASSQLCVDFQTDYDNRISKPSFWNSGEWHHYGFTFEQSTGNIKLYVDGVGTAFNTSNLSTMSGKTQMILNNEYYSATAKSWALTYIYKKVLSGTDVLRLYTEGGGTV